MKSRTDEDVLSLTPIDIKFGDKAFKIKVPSVKQARAWRLSFVTNLKEVAARVDRVPTTLAEMTDSLHATYMDLPEQILTQVLAYDEDFDKDFIEDNASEEQVSYAFSVICSFCYPFAQPLATVRQVLKAVK